MAAAGDGAPTLPAWATPEPQPQQQEAAAAAGSGPQLPLSGLAAPRPVLDRKRKAPAAAAADDVAGKALGGSGISDGLQSVTRKAAQPPREQQQLQQQEAAAAAGRPAAATGQPSDLQSSNGLPPTQSRSMDASDPDFHYSAKTGAGAAGTATNSAKAASGAASQLGAAKPGAGGWPWDRRPASQPDAPKVSQSTAAAGTQPLAADTAATGLPEAEPLPQPDRALSIADAAAAAAQEAEPSGSCMPGIASSNGSGSSRNGAAHGRPGPDSRQQDSRRCSKVVSQRRPAAGVGVAVDAEPDPAESAEAHRRVVLGIGHLQAQRRLIASPNAA